MREQRARPSVPNSFGRRGRMLLSRCRRWPYKQLAARSVRVTGRKSLLRVVSAATSRVAKPHQWAEVSACNHCFAAKGRMPRQSRARPAPLRIIHNNTGAQATARRFAMLSIRKLCSTDCKIVAETSPRLCPRQSTRHNTESFCSLDVIEITHKSRTFTLVCHSVYLCDF